MFSYIQVGNANCDWIQDDVDECEKAGNPEREDE